MFIDTHCHLTDRHCADGDAERAIANAMAAGVGAMICPTADPADIPGALKLAQGHNNIFCTIGIHPEYINANPDEYLTDDILGDPRVVGVGEIGFPLPKEYDNMLVAGRCLSAEHAAHSAVRIMPICACMGEAAGTALALAHKTNKNAHTVDITALRARLLEKGAAL